MKRIFFILVILFCIIWLHPLVAVLLSTVLGFFVQGNSYEIIITGIVLDSLYGSVLSVSFVMLPLYTLLGIALFMLAYVLKRRLNLYA